MWHATIAFGQHTWSNDVGRGMPPSPLGSTNSQTTSGVACHHRPWTTCTVGRRRAWNDITALGQYTRSDYVGRGMTSPPLDSTHSRTTSGVAFHHRLWAAHTVKRRWAWHDITTFGQHTRSNYVGLDMPTPPLDSQNGRTTSSVAFHYRFWAAHTVGQRLVWHDIITFRQHKRSNDVGCGITSPP